MSLNIEVKSNDTFFSNSPDTGPNCLCSRCHKPIMDIALRIWPEDISGEYRYHFHCQETEMQDIVEP